MADLGPFSDIVRVQPFAGLVIDPSTWGAAHDYHRSHHRLHLLSMHGSGIVSGLTVVPTDPPSDAVLVEPGVAIDAVLVEPGVAIDAVLVEPGVAIDAAGEVIVIAERERIAIDARGGAVYLAIQHVEAAPMREDGSPDDDPQEARGRVVEAHRVAALTEPPQTPAIELARVAIEGSGALAVTAARNPWAPGPNEIDGRHRPASGGQVPLEVRVALIAGPGAESGSDHVRGFSHLLRACAFAGVRATPVFATNGEVP